MHTTSEGRIWRKVTAPFSDLPSYRFTFFDESAKKLNHGMVFTFRDLYWTLTLRAPRRLL